MDSFMYQTVGHNVIHLIAQALELPLYRQPILGSAVATSRTYDLASSSNLGTQTDEVESMHTLLLRVKEMHPEVNAVSTGAILSDYQRTRVESVAIRLGLTPLSYLWQYPFLPPYAEASLLHDMNNIGQDSRIIKVASGALDESFLWKNVADNKTITRLQKSAERFGMGGDGSTIGEGGEYETLAIDGPPPLWKQSIIVDEADRAIVPGSAGTATIEIRRASVLPKQFPESDGSTPSVRQPPMLDDILQALQDDVLSHVSSTTEIETRVVSEGTDPISIPNFTSTHGNLTIYSTITAPGSNAVDQTRGIMTKILGDSPTYSSSIVYTLILLRNMEDFAAVNAVYGSFFDRPNPPSRVTVSCGNRLPHDTLVAISFLCADESLSASKQGLHVQSRSYWAPANIGPYSQAVSIPTHISSTESDTTSPRLVYIAGQIPLVPASMSLLPASASPTEQTILSLQHLWRIGTATHVSLWLGGVLFLSRTASPGSYIPAAAQAWKGIHSPLPAQAEPDMSDSDDVDIWDRRHGLGGQDKEISSTYRSTVKTDCVPPLFVAQVESLPRGADVEWSATGYASRDEHFGVEVDRECEVHHRVIAREAESVLAGWVAVSCVSEAARIWKSAGLETGRRYTVYTAVALPEEVLDLLRPTVVPCHSLWDACGKSLEAVIGYVA
ncbi:hypothetical protein ANO11243_068420 [Dothideomycetidae sp. 11243]|nr:hypothetical protein ANO11243_068420 [fungal sp. No.11243]